MAATTSVSISGTKTNKGTGSNTISVGPFENTDAPLATTTQSFGAGTFAAVTFPALVGSATIQGVIIKPPASNTGTITWKGVTGDTGIPVHKTKAALIPLDGVTSSNFGILCQNATVIEFEWL